MHAWFASLTRNRLLELALALALGSTGAAVASSFSGAVTGVLAQHVGKYPDPEFLNRSYLYVKVGGTYIDYGSTLAALLTLGLLGLVAWAIVRRRDRQLGECPFCASRIPYESTHCAYCGSGVSPGEP